MEIKAGTVVKSSAGHDGNRFFVVLKVENNFAYIADGKLRTLSKQKKKNIKHLIKTDSVIDISLLETDRKLRRFLWPFNYGDDQSAPE